MRCTVREDGKGWSLHLRAIPLAAGGFPGPCCHPVFSCASLVYASTTAQGSSHVWSWAELSLCMAPALCPAVKRSICPCLRGGSRPLGLNRWGQIMFSPFSVINSNHPSVASPGAANTSKRRPRRNFSSLLNVSLSTCLSVKTERREENWNQHTGSEVSINVRERQVCLDCKLLLADGLTILQLEICCHGGGGRGGEGRPSHHNQRGAEVTENCSNRGTLQEGLWRWLNLVFL